MKICIIVRSKEHHSARRLVEAGEKRGHAVSLSGWDELEFSAGSRGAVVTCPDGELKDFDALIVRNPSATRPDGVREDRRSLRTIVAGYAERHGLALINSTFFRQHQIFDKLSQQMLLAAIGLPGLTTGYPALADPDAADFPQVGKLVEGSLGKQVFKLDTPDDLERFRSERQKDGLLHLIQKYIPGNCDWRVMVIGEKVFGVIRREAQPGEWRTNVPGSRYSREELDPVVEKMALAVASAAGLEYAGLDLIKDSSGWRVIEINSSPAFRVFEEIFPETDVAGEIIAQLERRHAAA